MTLSNRVVFENLRAELLLHLQDLNKKDETFFRTWGIRAEISGNHDAYYVTKYIYIYVKSQYMPWMCLAGVPAWRPRRSTGPMAQVPQGVENKRRGRRTNPRSVTWDVHP